MVVCKSCGAKRKSGQRYCGKCKHDHYYCEEYGHIWEYYQGICKCTICGISPGDKKKEYPLVGTEILSVLKKEGGN